MNDTKACGVLRALLWLAAVVGWSVVGSGQTPVAKHVVRAGSSVTAELLVNGSLDEQRDGKFAGWRRFHSGYSVDRSEAHSGHASARVEADRRGRQAGIGQTVVVRQHKTAPLLISGWSKARNVSGAPDSGYAVYVDLVYEDGTPLWGQTARFATGTHDWQRAELVVVPRKPVRQLTVYGLFRGHTGTVWFDDFSVQQVRTDQRVGLFDGVLVRARPRPPAADAGQGLVFVRDAAADSDLYLIGTPTEEARTVDVLELQLAVTLRKRQVRPKVWRVDLQVQDRTGQDRAVNLYYAVSLPAVGWRWWDNVQQWRVISAGGQYVNAHACGVGATGAISRYPFACVSGPDRACSLVVTEPRSCRLCYDAVQQELYVSFDFGLSPETKHPGGATASVFAAEVDPEWAMRATAELYYRLLPGSFDQRRVPAKQGNWMAFTKISSVQQPEDFGFAVHEGNNDVRWDNQHGILPFVYVEPASFWMRMPKQLPRTSDAALGWFEKLLADPKSPQHERAWATKLSGLYDSAGRYVFWIRNAPWCDGAVFANCADPDVPEDGQHQNQAHQHLERLRAALRAAEKDGGLAGIYLDSLEGWGFILNWRREHWKAADLPLTYDKATKRPVLLNMMSTWEFTKAISDWMHAEGKLVMANSVPHNFPWLANLLDLMGTETNWLRGGRFAPPSADYMYLKRTMAWHKPYMFLMNTNYDRFGPELVERYMQRCLFYGMFPGFFSEDASTNPYFGNPKWYNRDRHLFRKYVPVIREVAEAGWEVVTRARSSNPAVWVERFGGWRPGPVYLTLMNTSSRPQQTTLTLDQELLRRRGTVLEDLLTGRRVPLRAGRVRLTLQPEQVLALRLR